MADPDESLLIHSFDYPPNDGGISRLCAEIAGEYAQKPAGACVLTQRTPTRGGATIAPHVPEIRLTARRPLREWQALRALHRSGRGRPVIAGIWYPEGLLVMLAGVRPLVILAYGSELMPTPSRVRRALWRRLQRHVLTAADLVIACSEYTRGLVLASAPEANAIAIPLAVDHQRFAPGDRAAAKNKYGVGSKHVLCSVSRIHLYKGHEVVLQALASLPPEERDRFVYLVAGRGPDLPALQERAGDLGLGHLVRWLGYVPEEELPDLYRAADLFVLCTREVVEQQEVEGFGLVFLEAQACAIPVVGARTGGIPDAIRDGEGGWLIEQDDVQALSQILLRLAAEPEVFRAAGAAARLRVEREFTWSHYLQRFTRALQEVGIQPARVPPGE
jgi:phosphatidylinositol alpha-1,6-mannosyltransferase